MDRQPPGPTDSLFGAYQEHLRRGHEALIAGQPGEALEAYRAAAELAGGRPLPHVSVGRVLLIMGRAAEALEAFERALERAPRDPAALGGRAEALLRLGRREDAAQANQQLAQLDAAGAGDGQGLLDPTALPPAEAMVLAGERAWQEGRLADALDEWVGAARAHAADGHLDAALDVCQRALLADGGAVKVHLEMSRLYLARGLTEQATERMLLLARLLELQDLPELRAELAALAGEAATTDRRLAQLADRLGAPPVA